MSQHKDLPPNSQAWAKEVDALMEENKQLKEVVRRLCENAGIDFSNPKRGLNPVSEIPSTNNPVGQKLSSLADVQIYNVADKQVLSWSGKDQRWLPVTLPAPAGGGGGTVPIPMSYFPGLEGIANIDTEGVRWDLDSNSYQPLGVWAYSGYTSYTGVNTGGRHETWATEAVLSGAGNFNDASTMIEQYYALGQSYTAISSNTPGWENQSRFVVNPYKVFIQYVPFQLERFSSANRPAMGDADGGAMLFDIDLGIPVIWNGTAWTNFTGTAV